MPEVSRDEIMKVLNEELSAETKSQLISDLEEEVETCIDKIMESHGVHKRGLSEQQAALVYRRLSHKIEKVIDDYATIRISSSEREKLEGLTD